ncbi:MAG: hypothetical protein J1F17_06895 [Oscillospiraceae bacterium]|nr:hypothetical protein [Oscillospiraceae bacterium]
MNIALELYNLVYGLLFSGELPPLMVPIAQELSTIITIIGVSIAVLLPIGLVFGFVKWIWNFIRG